MTNLIPIVLVSASPRRRKLFTAICPDFITAEADIDESLFLFLPAKEQVIKLAEAKCKKKAAEFKNSIVVGCDTLIELNDAVFGKPADREDAIRMLRLLSGRTHNVHTGVYVISPDESVTLHCMTKVSFYEMSGSEIEEYVDTGEPFDKAGSYGIQGMAARYIRGIEGDYFNVLGLPVSMLYQEFRRLGIV